MVILINGAGIVFRVIPPIIADRIGPINVMFPVTLAWAIVGFSWLAVDNVPGLYVFSCFYGICSGSFQCLTATAIASITKRLDTVGTRLGMAFSISSFASLTTLSFSGKRLPGLRWTRHLMVYAGAFGTAERTAEAIGVAFLAAWMMERNEAEYVPDV